MKVLLYEIKKIMVKPVNKAVFILLLAVTLTAGFLTIRDVRYITDSGEHITGVLAAGQLKKAKEAWKGALTEDVLKQVIKKHQDIQKEYVQGADENQWEAEDTAFQKEQGMEDIKDMLRMAFSSFDVYDHESVDRLSPEDADRFYERRMISLQEWLDTGSEHFTDKEKDFLTGQYEKLETPFYYEYADGWKALLDSQYLLTLMTILVVAVGFFVAGIFSDEFQLKADAIFFSARLGRGRAILAKIGAGVTAATVVYWGVILLYTVFVLSALGFEGAHSMVQAGNNWKSIYNITYFQDFLLTAGGGYIGSLFILTLAMVVSAKSRSTVLAITVPFALSCAPMFLGRVPALTRIMTLFPDQLLRINKSLEDFILFEIGGKVMGYITLLVPLYLILSLVLLPVLYRVYKKGS